MTADPTGILSACTTARQLTSLSTTVGRRAPTALCLTDHDAVTAREGLNGTASGARITVVRNLGVRLQRTTGVAGRSAMDKFSHDLLRDPSQLFDDHIRSSSWAVGGVGEMFVARELEKLGAAWFITHDVGLGSSGGNLDHVLVGPPGIFVLNTKYHGDKRIVVDGDVYVGGRRTTHVHQGEREAHLASSRLTVAYGARVAAASLVVLIGVHCAVRRQPASRVVRVAHVSDVVQLLTGLRARLTTDDVARLTLCVRDDRTWLRRK